MLVLTQYKIIRRIARGGMAEIYLGRSGVDADSGKLVAIKRILPHFAQDEEFVQMFRDEADICKRLMHPNIIQVFRFEKIDESYALIMEYLDGADLRTLLSACERQRTRLSVAMAVYITAEAARALHYAHTKTDDLTGRPLGIVHRDVSPQNILIGYQGEVKITDFGIADASSKQNDTKPGIVKGKYSYMSPEQVNAEAVDLRSDIFSLAIVTWEMLSMRRLFASDMELETIKLVQNCRIPFRLREINPEIDPELEQIIDMGLMKDRRRRFQSAQAFETALRNHLATRYKEFSPADLGRSVQDLFAERRRQIQQEIDGALGNNVLPPPPVALPNQTAQPHTAPLSGGEVFSTDPGTISKIPLLPAPASVSAVEGAKPAPRPSSSGMNRPADLTISRHQQTISAPASATPRGSQRPPPSSAKKTYSQRSTSQPPTLLLAVALILLGAAILLLVSRRNFTAADPLATILLQTSPAAVRLTLDGRDLDQGLYKQTPLKLMLQPGRHRLKIGRAGYITQSLEIDAEPGGTLRQDRIVLEKAAHATWQPLRIIVTPGNLKIPISLNDGFYSGDTPATVNDLEVNKNHVLTYYPSANEHSRGKPMRCSFSLSPLGRPVTLRIELSVPQTPKCMLLP